MAKQFIKWPSTPVKATTDRDASNKAYKELSYMAHQFGYTLYGASVSSKGVLQITLEPDNHRAPDIYIGGHRRGVATVGDIKVRIATVSHGSLFLDEYSEYMENVRKAYEFGKWLESWEYWGSLEVYDEV